MTRRPPPSSSTSATSSTAGIPTPSSSGRSPTTRRACASSRTSTSTAGTRRSTAAGPMTRPRPSSARNSPQYAASDRRLERALRRDDHRPGARRPRDRRGARRARRAAVRDHQFLGRFLAALPRAGSAPSSPASATSSSRARSSCSSPIRPSIISRSTASACGRPRRCSSTTAQINVDGALAVGMHGASLHRRRRPARAARGRRPALNLSPRSRFVSGVRQRWPEKLWIVRHGQSAGNVARDAAARGRASP